MPETADIALASTDAHVVQIKQLQMENLRRLLPLEVQEREGFVTAEYSIDYLRNIHSKTPAVVALAQVNGVQQVVGYVLAATKQDSLEHDLLKDLVGTVDGRCKFEKKKLKDLNYIVVGQLCVAKDFRGQRLASKMYEAFAQEYKSRGFECAMTDVAADNEKSLKTHKKSGWVVVDSLDYSGVVFEVIVLPFN
ncbi:UNVERIFIED_CONTAM: hypothetical protein HDU68_001513 [Siphonaria sp. JEL0065]|nr:hypothetical protein HDU68_001513 [Siphonaria sp. JEL0065]